MSASTTPSAVRENHRHGIYWMVLTMLMFVSMDTVAKYLSTRYPVPQIVWARYVFHLLLLFTWLGTRLPSVLRTQRLGLQLGRSLLLLLTTLLFFTALSRMALVDASVIMFIGPIVVTVLAGLILRERVGPRVRRRPSVGVMQLGRHYR